MIAAAAERVVGHAAVVERTIEIGGAPLRTGYVEAVAVAADRRGHGLGRRLMEEVAAIIAEEFELGMLGTGVQAFYERLGWRVWRGPSGPTMASSRRRTRTAT